MHKSLIKECLPVIHLNIIVGIYKCLRQWTKYFELRQLISVGKSCSKFSSHLHIGQVISQMCFMLKLDAEPGGLLEN